MTLDELYQELNYVDHTREKRLYYSNLVMENTDLMPLILEIFFMVNDKISTKAFWVLEYITRRKLDFFLPLTSDFIEKMHTLKLDSSLRPAAKICEVLVSAYYGKKPSKVKSILSIEQREKIAETCFDWLIQDQKVAVKAHSMLALYLLGSELDWIHPELIETINKNLPFGTIGFQNRGKKIIRAIETGTLLKLY